jgi:hypothetical protein
VQASAVSGVPADSESFLVGDAVLCQAQWHDLGCLVRAGVSLCGLLDCVGVCWVTCWIVYGAASVAETRWVAPPVAATGCCCAGPSVIPRVQLSAKQVDHAIMPVWL